MKIIKYIVFPFSVLYGIITRVRNTLFDINVLKSKQFKLPILVVGNLSVGGTGKTPHIEYLINLLSHKYNIAVLSRGYKRKTSGFVIANANSKVQDIGDEPMQFFKKHANITVAVNEDRVEGINKLLLQKKIPNVILLDDGFQHRKLKASLNILLTTYNNLYCEDYLLPFGKLREGRKGAQRAQIIIVTKCPKEVDKENVINKLHLLKSQKVFFTSIKYDDFIYGHKDKILLSTLKEYKIVLVTGIANANPMLKFLERQKIKFEHIDFPDHFNFKNKDIKKIEKKYDKLNSEKKLILTTEKDFIRTFKKSKMNIFYLPIKVEFKGENNKEKFNKIILKHVEQSTRNS